MSSSTTTFSPSFTGLRVAVGVICLLLGIAVLAWPHATLTIIAILFGIELILVGLARIFLSSGLKAQGAPGWVRPVTIVLGALTVILGVLLIFRPGASLVVLAWLLAAGWLIDGISSLVSGLRSGRTGMERFASIAYGVLSVLGAIILFVYPDKSLLVLTWLGGIILIVFGVVSLIAAIVLRKQPAATA